MRVAVDARHLSAGRGVARYTRRMCGALAAQPGVAAVHALVPGRGQVERVPGVTFVRTRAPSRIVHGAGALIGGPSVRSLCGGDADAVWIPAPAPVAPGGPYVLTIHDLSWIERPQDFTGYERLWHRLMAAERLAARAGAVICDHEAIARSVAAHWPGIAPRVVEPGTDAAPTPAPAPPPGATPGGRRGGMGTHASPFHPFGGQAGRRRRPYVLYVGALEPRKGLDVLAAAWARAGLDADLVLAGSGRTVVPGAVALGRVSDEQLHELYAGALALVLPSHLEGYGFPPREAAAHGVPSVVSDLPTLRIPGTLRVPPGDAEALAAALASLPAERDRLAAELEPARSWNDAGRELATILAEVAL